MANITRKISNVALHIGVHYIHTAPLILGLNKVMSKVLSGPKKRKHRYIEAPLINPNTFGEKVQKSEKHINFKRLSVLNKLFMRHITDLMTTGPQALDLAGYRIEISKVQVTPDYKDVNVFWLARGTQSDKMVENLLNSRSGQLRHELSQLQVMGVVPKIRFVKDKMYAKNLEVELRLAKADFGDDYVPPEPILTLKTEFELNTKLNPELKEKIQGLDKEELPENHEDVPPMPQNTLGLNHSEIMGRIKKLMSKAQAAHRFKNNTEENFTKSFNTTPVEYASLKKQREAFKQFLAKREILRNKARRLEKNYQPEMDYLYEELEKMKEEELNSVNLGNYFNDEDYIDDVDEDDIK